MRPSRTGLDEFVAGQVDQWLAIGFAVVATDYVGLGTPGVHPYLDGPSEASSVLDGVRAARNVEPSLSDKFVALGESQGGHAALFVANLASTYAPELDFRGAVAIVPPSNFDQLLPITATITPPQSHEGLMRRLGYVLTGLRAARPDLNVNSYLTPLGVRMLNEFEVACNGPGLAKAHQPWRRRPDRETARRNRACRCPGENDGDPDVRIRPADHACARTPG